MTNAGEIYDNMSGGEVASVKKSINSFGDWLSESTKGIGDGVSSFFDDFFNPVHLGLTVS